MREENISPIIGIDLGTSNSAVSWFENGSPRLIMGSQGERLTPSVVGLDDEGNLIIGAAAKARLVSHPQMTVASFKRYMGTDKTWTLGKRQFRAEELSALVLRKLKTDAEVALGCPVNRTVITVPAYFNDAQRKAVKAAGKLAGLHVERLLNEPTAAALAYGLADNSEQKFLIFDLGGGTFDVSIVDMFEGVIEVRASSGDAWLGGDDFTDAIRQWMLAQSPALADVPLTCAAELTALAETIKQTLSMQDSAAAQLTYADVTHQWTLQAETFAECAAPLLARLKKTVVQVLQDAQFDARELDHIILVGGATRMALVRQLATRMFGRFPRNELNPDEVVALGAGVQAGLIAEDRALDDIVLTDVMPYSLGVAVGKRLEGGNIDAGYFMPLIERNAFVPVSIVERFSTLQDNQRVIEIAVYQGEARRVSDNLLLDRMQIDIPARRAGEVSVDVRFTYTLDGILEVECTLEGGTQTSTMIIEKAPGVLNEEEIAERLRQLDGLKMHPRDVPENRQLLAEASRRYEQLLGERRLMLDHYTSQFEMALNSQDVRHIASAREALRQVLAQFDDGM
ncbi:molecular chaperone HscC [Kosakonia oryzendophytica]|uniref:Molecular chaperone HscC n=1 Tax=Kosakonia oryzendophytica TaxID=1005665 RepID=A0A1C4AP26_9ENTR|nr:molecular chaperone HscC [Kosakonia oryzendophytica]TDT60710.1 molecular chaperone HscC [Enterobacter sp. AG5470]WBT57261.1 molecular chaperone HscC [Kosakonia oryzendophytica]SCB96311.1 molecular chaperone HscC [Kosakonia oryzendophytica]